MPKLPRDCGAKRLTALLKQYGYVVTRQRGSHIRLWSEEHEHSITVPDHEPIKLGTLSAILAEVATVLNKSKDDLVRRL